MKKLILLILVVGILYRLFLTSGGNFLFNMDNARDFVDVREMVELNKLRLTGPTSAIEGFYNGPLWYYLLAIPYMLTDGNPYGAIIMQIFLWAIGGYFLLKLVSGFGKWWVIPVGLAWVSSNYIVLTNLYSFNPNPVTLLTPLLIYSLVKYLKEGGGWIILSWFLAGAFFNFEMNAGVYIPLIILISIFLINNRLFKDKYFWLGGLIFIGTLLPQILFDIRHQFIMSKSVLSFLSQDHGAFNLPLRIQTIGKSFFDVLVATLMNKKTLSLVILFLSIPVFKRFFASREKNITVFVSLLLVLIPFLGYLVIPTTVNPWHLGIFAATSLVLVGFILSGLWKYNFFGKIISIILFVVLSLYSVNNIVHFFTVDFGKPNMDPSLYKNEIAAIDFVYKYANGQNFKVYTYLPSVYDYPYQYLIWWYGLKEFGYLPIDYAYAPNKPPQYIPGKINFSAKTEDLKKRQNSNLVFLIKEPNRNYTRFGWEGEFIKLESIEKKMVGPLEIEVKRETTQ